MPDPTKNALDPAATDLTAESARSGREKIRDPREPAAVVGLGASAGGVAALQQFFSDMAPDTGLAFVVVMHLSPEHESHLAEVLQQKTAMPVMQVTEPRKVQPNHVYVIPPNKQLTFEADTLQLVEPQQARGRRVTIDLFFRTLAQAYGQRAVGVILSGTDSDGVIGLKHIRAQGGVTIAQDPEEAEHNSMPATAISTGMVDWVLPVVKMASKLAEFVRNEERMQLPPEIPETEAAHAKVIDAPGGETVSGITRATEDENALAEILAVLRVSTGHNFAHYKRATVLRRVARRLQVNSMESLPRYLQFIRQHPAEARALLQDLLIGVTHFFRDWEAFTSLEANVPQLFAGKRKEDQIRVWVAGCATGEEAYSIAMLLCEHAERLDSPPAIQIFASDLDEQSIQDAREGLYPATIETDVSPERLRHFFVRDHGRYRVRQDLREKVLFASHNLLKDAPFSRLDLVSCRNLLIYLNGKAQEQVFDIFHFSLRAGGLLFLGGSENDGSAQALFTPLDAKHRVFVRRSVPRPNWKLPMLPVRAPVQARAAVARSRDLPALPFGGVAERDALAAESLGARQGRREALFGELHLRLLEEYGPPSIVVNDLHDIVHLSENAGRYLQFAAGEPTANVIKVVHSALQIELRTALFRAEQTKQKVTAAPRQLEIEGTTEVIALQVRPMQSADPAEGFYLVLFEKQNEGTTAQLTAREHDAVARELDDEIQYLKEQLSATVEQYEVANEELKASNEEFQAMNEEMRSATEELETSKEELQSVNEELVTVNHELKSNVEELSHTNADLNNLMASTDIGTIFLDRQLRIERFTPSAQKIFNLIPADYGRPLSDITNQLAYAEFISDAEQVLERLATVEREVRVGDESWYLTRIAPYRTADDRIAGVVATFVDITRRRRAEAEKQELSEMLAEQLHRFSTVMTSVPDFIYHFDLEGRFTYANQSLLDLLERNLEQVIGRNFFDLEYPPELAEKLQRQIQEVIETRQPLKDETPYTSAVGTRQYEYIFSPLLRSDGSVEAVVGVTRDIMDRKEAERALRLSEERFRQFAENSADVFWIVDVKTGIVEYINPVYEQMWGEPREAVMQDTGRWLELVHPEDRKIARAGMPAVLAGETCVVEYRVVRPGTGEIRWIRDTGFPIRNAEGAVYRVAGVAQDVTEDRRSSEDLRRSEERFRLLVEGARDYAMFLLDHQNIITYWSTGAERIFGWTQEEAVGQGGDMIFTPEDRANEVHFQELEIAQRDGRAADRRYHLRKDDSRFWTDGVMMRLNRDDGTLRGFAKVARDASDQREVEDALRHARDEMEQRVVERTRDLLTTNRELERTMAERQRLEKELLEISEREKRRIGEDLHDMVCQELTATALFLKSRAKEVSEQSPAAAETLEESAQIVNRNVGLTRDLARGLQPAELSGAGLKEALRALAAQACEMSEIKCHYKCARGVRVTDSTIALHLYRVAQEAMKNAIKHSGAKNVLISLDKNTENVCVSVQDDGKGFAPKRRSKGLGIQIMRYRANALGGELKITRRRSGGMEITCVIPNKK